MLSSALYVAEKTPSRLVVVDPPYYWVGGVFLVLGGILLLGTLLAASQKETPRAVLWIGLLFSLPFLIPGTWVATNKTTLIFARDTGTMTMQVERMLMYRHQEAFPFADIAQADVEAGRGTRRIVIRLRSGGAIGIGGHTTQSGQYEMVKTINDFLFVH